MTSTEDDRDFIRWYGPWAPLTPSEVARVLEGVAIPWWIVGGWAMDAFTGQPRDHEDVDVGFFSADLATLLAHLAPSLCVWSNVGGTLRPLRRPEDVLDGARQFWVRADGMSPWLIDLAMTPHEGTVWVSVRDARLRLPIEAATFVGDDGIRYLRPEIVLHMEARLRREKDERDLAKVLPLLEPGARAWLADALNMTNPGHPWLERLA